MKNPAPANSESDSEIPDFSPSSFLKGRRPYLFSDSQKTEEISLPKITFEYHLETLTKRKQEYEFEHFARKLAEKEICPNLIPQTGPTGGGDGKVDTETYPVSTEISIRWYQADPAAANERWAFAFSAKKAWKGKVIDDVKKIVETGRGYTRIYFITNQFVKSSTRSQLEDQLTKVHGVPVTILDRSWIVEKVYGNKRLELAIDCLKIEGFEKRRSGIQGTNDFAREQELEDLEKQIGDSERYRSSKYQLVEDCLDAALLARGLERPRIDIESLFDRAERIAKQIGYPPQLLRIAYDRAWTAFWWHNDFATVSKLYDEVEKLALQNIEVVGLEKLCNLYTVLDTSVRTGQLPIEESKIEERTKSLRFELERMVLDDSHPNAALWARTQLAFMNLNEALYSGQKSDVYFAELGAILQQSRGMPGYAAETTIDVILEIGTHFTDDEAYDSLFETVVAIKRERAEAVETGEMLLRRGFQKHEGGRNYEAIQLLGRAQLFLALKENRPEFTRALAGCGLTYEAVGLNWAARANVLSSLNQVFVEFKETGSFPSISIYLVTFLINVEFRLGRVPAVLLWLSVADIIATHQYATDTEAQSYIDNRNHQDFILSILLLNTDFWELSRLGFLPTVLDELELYASWASLMFALGQVEPILEEFNPGVDDEKGLEGFFVKVLQQPATKELPERPQFLREKTLMFRTNLIGCIVNVRLPNKRHSIYLAETLLGALESLFATCVLTELHPVRPEMKILINDKKISAGIETAFEIIEDEEVLVIRHYEDLSAEFSDSTGLFTWLQENLIKLGVRIFRIPDVETWIHDLLVEERGLERALNFSQVAIPLENILGKDFNLSIDDYRPRDSTNQYSLIRDSPWTEDISTQQIKTNDDVSSIVFADEPPVDLDRSKLKHSDYEMRTIIDVDLWNKAGWTAMAFLSVGENPTRSYLGFGFKDIESGKAIFRKWQRQLGSRDIDEVVKVSIFTGIDKAQPASYRVLIASDPKLGAARDGRLTYFMARSHRMDPPDSINLDNFIKIFNETGEYGILPLQFIDELRLPTANDFNLAIYKREITIKPAWQIDPNGLEVMGLTSEEDDLLVPEGVDISRLMERLKKSGR